MAGLGLNKSERQICVQCVDGVIDCFGFEMSEGALASDLCFKSHNIYAKLNVEYSGDTANHRSV